MKYLVMEIHPAYAVLMDEEGRYLKAANLRYQVGDTVGDIVALREPAKRAMSLARPLAGAAALAACLCLVFFGYYRPNFTAYGTLRIQINPDVEMTISRTERVLELEGLNEDGEALIAGYTYEGKSRDRATDELVDRAIDMGYLSGGDTITITVDSPDAGWQAEEEQQVRQQLEDRYGEQVTIRLGSPEAYRPPEGPPREDETEVVIPVAPATPPQSGTAGAQDDTDYAPGSDGVTDYGPNADGVTDYGDTDYGPNNDGVTDYGDTDDGPYQGGVTEYGDKDDGHGQGGDRDDDDGDDNDDDHDGGGRGDRDDDDD